MKKYILVFLSLACLTTMAQTSASPFDGNKWVAPYTLSRPKGWDVERFLIPIEFAPQIPYKGVEDIRFTPGWGHVNSDEYWSYAFLWYLEDKPEINEEIVETNLRAYYTGLVGRNIAPRKIPNEKLFPVKTTIKRVKTVKGDLKTFQGIIYMLDYMEQQPITLNCVVHVKICTGQQKTFIFNEISPKSYNDAVWQSLNQLWTDFNCQQAEDPK